MSSPYEQFTFATGGLMEVQQAAMTKCMYAMFDAGVNAIEMNMDALRAVLAASTVATRQMFLAAGGHGWMTPAVPAVHAVRSTPPSNADLQADAPPASLPHALLA